MLYELAHFVKERCGFLWNAVEWGNSKAFCLIHHKGLAKIPAILEKYSTDYTVRLATESDSANLAKFFAEQPAEAYKFFNPHKFDENSLRGIIRNQAFITFLVLSGEAIVGYFFLRSFVNGKAFRGRIVDYKWRNKGIAKKMGLVMNDVVTALHLRLFGSISPDNYASLASTKAVNNIRIIKTLDNGYYYIEYLPKNWKSPKVLILANKSTGLYHFRAELLHQLIEKKCKVYISVPNGDFVEEMKSIGCKVLNTPVNRHGVNPITDFKLFVKYFCIIKAIKPNIVFSYTIKPNIYGGFASQICRVPYVVNVTGLGSAVENSGLLQKVTLALYRAGLRGAQKVFFQNEANQNFMLQHGVVHKSFALIPGSGVNLDHFVPLPYPQSDDTVHFAFVSRIMKAKGIDQYLDAAQHFAGKNCVFHVCGYCESEYQGKLQELADKGIVFYHGMVRDVNTVLRDVHCTIHPSFYPEGISNVLLESCACARPIITTDRSGCREVIDDGVNGFVVRQKDSADLIEKIGKFLALTHEQKQKMGEAGRAKVEREFNRQIVVDAYLKELEAV